MADYDESNILERPIPYKILREMHLADDGSYHVQMDLKAGIDEEAAEEIIKVMTEANILYQIENTDPQLYDVNYAFFEDLWNDLWLEETGKTYSKPVHFGSFIENYVKSYLKDEKASTIHEMLVEEFFLGLNRENENRLPSNFEEFLHNLSENFEGKRATHKHIQHGINYTG